MTPFAKLFSGENLGCKKNEEAKVMIYRFRAVLALIALVTAPGLLLAGNPLSTLSIDAPGQVAPGGALNAYAMLDNGDGELQGWSYTVCHDPADMTLNSATTGSTTAAANGGSAPGFESLNMFANAWSHGVVINLFGDFTLPVGSGYELAYGSYTNDMPDGGLTTISFGCVAGSPPVATTVVVGGASLAVNTAGQDVESHTPPVPPSTFWIDAPATTPPGSDFETRVMLDNESGNIQGWSLGQCHDSGALTLNSMELGATSETINGGSELEFWALNFEAGGFTMGAVISLMGTAVLPVGNGYEIVVAQYTNDMADGNNTDLNFCGDQGDPVVTVVVVVGGTSLSPSQVGANVQSYDPPIVDFIRGDANQTGSTDLSDGIWMLSDLFLGGAHNDCFGSNNANGDGSYDAADAIYVLTWAFLGGAAPPAPWPDCGNQGNEDECETSSCP